MSEKKPEESRRALGMLNLLRPKSQGVCRGAGEGTKPVTTACPEAELAK